MGEILQRYPSNRWLHPWRKVRTFVQSILLPCDSLFLILCLIVILRLYQFRITILWPRHALLRKGDITPQLKNRLSGKSYNYLDDYKGITSRDMEVKCDKGSNLAMCKRGTWFGMCHNKDRILVTSAMMHHGFPLPLTEEMAKLLKHFDACLIQLSQVTVLIYE